MDDKRKNVYTIIALSLLVLSPRVILAINTYMIGTDSLSFLEMAQHIFNGDFSSALKMKYHPFYPFLIAYTHFFVGSFELAGIIVSIVFSTLTVIPLYYIISNMWSRLVAIISILFYAFQPNIVEVQADIMTEGIFIFLFISSIALGWKALREKSLPIFVMSGITSTLCYLTRVEGLIVVALFGLWALYYILREFINQADWQRLLLYAVTYYAIITIIAFPYILWIHSKTGKWHFTIKPSALLASGDIQKVDIYKGYKEEQKRIADELGSIGTSLFSLKTLIKSAHWVLAPLLLIYMLMRLFKKPERIDIVSSIYILTFSIIYIIGILYGANKGIDVSYRYFIPPIILLIPFAVLGLLELIRIIIRNDVRRDAMLRWALVIFILLSYPKIFEHRRYDFTGFKEAGNWIKETSSPSSVILTTREALGFYAERRIYELLYTYKLVERDCKERRANYIIFSTKDLEKRERDFLDKLNNDGSFALIRSFPAKEKEGIYRVYVYAYKG